MLSKSQKTWSIWVRYMLNKIFPVLEDKHSSSRSVGTVPLHPMVILMFEQCCSVLLHRVVLD